MTRNTAALLRIHGRVQGVWFRGWTVDQAQALGLTGWVRNRRDGSVEALVSGPSDAVEAMIAACHDGPPTARVDLVEREPVTGLAAGGFTQKATV
jgi:acylphosphatase